MSDKTDMMDKLVAAYDMISTYSAGTVPAPGYISVSSTGTVKFQMSSAAEVQRWAESVDGTVHLHPWTDPTDKKKSVHHTLAFSHGNISVEVYFIEHID